MTQFLGLLGINPLDRINQLDGGVEIFFDQANAFAARHQFVIGQEVQMFVQGDTEKHSEIIKTTSVHKLQNIGQTPLGQPKPTGVEGEHDVGYPIDGKGDALKWDEVEIAHLLAGDFERQFMNVLTANAEDTSFQIRQALFNKSNYTKNDRYVAAIAVKALANQDGTLYNPKSGETDTSERQHYITTAYAGPISDANNPYTLIVDKFIDTFGGREGPPFQFVGGGGSALDRVTAAVGSVEILQARLPGQHLVDPVGVTPMVRRDVEDATDLEASDDLGYEGGLEHPAPMVSLLRPGIGEVHVELSHRGIGQARPHDLFSGRVAQQDPGPPAARQQPRHLQYPLERVLDAEKERIGILLHQGQQELSTPEAEIDHQGNVFFRRSAEALSQSLFLDLLGRDAPVRAGNIVFERARHRSPELHAAGQQPQQREQARNRRQPGIGLEQEAIGVRETGPTTYLCKSIQRPPQAIDQAVGLGAHPAPDLALGHAGDGFPREIPPFGDAIYEAVVDRVQQRLDRGTLVACIAARLREEARVSTALDAVLHDTQPLVGPLQVDLATDDADRAGDGTGFGEHDVGCGRHVVAARRGHVTHRDHHGFFLGHAGDRSPQQVG